MASEAKNMLMAGLTDRLHGRFVAVLDGLNKYRDPGAFAADMWQADSDLHLTLATAGKLAGASKQFVATLPAATDLNEVATALEQVTRDGG